MQEVMDAVAISTPSPDGTTTVIFAEENNKPVKVDIFIGKAGSTLRAWATCFAEIMSIGFQHGASIDEYIKILLGQTSDKFVRSNPDYSKPSFNIGSGPEAIAIACLKYKQFKYEQLSKELSLDNDDDEREPHGYFTNPTRKPLA